MRNFKNTLLLIVVSLIGLTITSCKEDTANQNHELASRKFQGIPSLAISPEGRIWATWYAGITPGEDENNYVVVSKDKGKSFQVRGACHVPKEVRDYDEHMIVEKKDKSLWMLIRTNYGIGESFSNDDGKTWSEASPSTIMHPSARFFIRRLASDNLLLVKHKPINERIDRSYLTAYISEDDGQSWSDGLLLDERRGVSYPDGQQSSDGTIHIIYDYSRTTAREILMATFTEEDIIAGDTTSTSVNLRTTISKYPDLELENEK